MGCELCLECRRRCGGRDFFCFENQKSASLTGLVFFGFLLFVLSQNGHLTGSSPCLLRRSRKERKEEIRKLFRYYELTVASPSVQKTHKKDRLR